MALSRTRGVESHTRGARVFNPSRAPPGIISLCSLLRVCAVASHGEKLIGEGLVGHFRHLALLVDLAAAVVSGDRRDIGSCVLASVVKSASLL